MRRAHALDPAALLIDQDGRIGPPDRVAQGGAERPHLLRVVDVAPEQDEAPGRASRKKATSSGVSSWPEQPAIKARVVMPAPYVPCSAGSRSLSCDAGISSWPRSTGRPGPGAWSRARRPRPSTSVRPARGRPCCRSPRPCGSSTACPEVGILALVEARRSGPRPPSSPSAELHGEAAGRRRVRCRRGDRLGRGDPLRRRRGGRRCSSRDRLRHRSRCGGSRDGSAVPLAGAVPRRT